MVGFLLWLLNGCLVCESEWHKQILVMWIARKLHQLVNPGVQFSARLFLLPASFLARFVWGYWRIWSINTSLIAALSYCWVAIYDHSMTVNLVSSFLLVLSNAAVVVWSSILLWFSFCLFPLLLRHLSAVVCCCSWAQRTRTTLFPIVVISFVSLF